MSSFEASNPVHRPLLSICIPTYNRAECLEDCLRSLERATQGLIDRVQIVISDNASTDHTPEVVQKWAAVLPIRYIRNRSPAAST